jgi:hypothetical protein
MRKPTTTAPLDKCTSKAATKVIDSIVGLMERIDHAHEYIDRQSPLVSF